jgi:AraC-like DNA-binding protein
MRQVAQFIPEVGGATDGEECARLAGCSYGHLQRVFRDFHGSYLKPYIDDCRVARADALAREGWKQQDIAAYFGQSPSSFRQWYKRAARQRPF